MDDRFKCRVWDKNQNKMLIPQDNINYCQIDNYIVSVEIFQNMSGSIRPVIRASRIFDNAILMQCTGIKDKNGKLVYDGDIVIYKANIKVVMFDEINLCHSLLWAKYYNPQWKSSVSGLRYDKVTKTKKIEVIGNIYENKELLNDR